MRVLLAEDDQVLSKSISNKISKLGFVVDVALDGHIAEQFLKSLVYDLIILDLNMPKIDGRDVLKHLRDKGVLTPVLVLTARAQLEDKVNALNLGADDYLTKPFSFEELEARCRALLRRSKGLANDRIEHGDLVVDRQACTVHINAELVSLTHTEYRLLDLMLSNTGKVLSKGVILDHLYTYDDAPSPSAVETYIARLRKSLSASSTFSLRTLRGLGYVVETIP